MFFPYGRFGKGRIVNDERLARIRRRHSWFMASGLLLVVFTGHFGWSVVARLLLAVPFGLLYSGWLYGLTRDLPVSGLKYSYREGVTQISRAFGWPLALAMVGMSVFIAYKLATLIGQRGFIPTDLFVSAFAVVMLGVGLFGLWANWRRDR